MITTLIRLPEEDYLLYKEISRENGISLAEYFRKAASKEAGYGKKGKGNYSFRNLGAKVIVKGGPKDASVHPEKYYSGKV